MTDTTPQREPAAWARRKPARSFRFLAEPVARAIWAEQERDEAEAEVARLREGMFRRGVTADGEAWIDCRGCGPLGLAARPAPHEPECWVEALLDRAR